MWTRNDARAATWLLLGMAGLAAINGCDTDLLGVERPGQVEADDLTDPAQSEVFVNSAIADFECAYANYVAATALYTDELRISTEFIAVTNWDLRRVTPDNANLGSGGCTAFGFGIWNPLQTARWQAEQAFEKISDFSDGAVPNRTVLLATASVYEGYSLTLIGEAFCEAAVDEGPLLQPDEVLEMAEDRFSRALELAGESDDEIANMARVGRARVRIALDDAAGASEDAGAVPAGFEKNATYSASAERRENRVHNVNWRTNQASVDVAFRDLEVDGVPDPRVPVFDAGRVGEDGFTQMWRHELYPEIDSPIPLATWNEAQLIIAEAEGGQEAVDAINRLRDEAGLPEFDSEDPEEIQDQILEERRRELFLQGHRLGDKLRFGLPFLAGENHKGQPYDDRTCLPLPDAERDNNPNL